MANSKGVALREITFATVREIIDLRVSDQQSGYVAPNAISIAEGLLNPGGWLRAIYAGDVPVGFAMLFDPKIPGAIARSPVASDALMLWRFMIDHRHQDRGYGKAAFNLLRTHAKNCGVHSLLTSYIPGEHSPEGFYLKLGFSKTGALRANGAEIELRLAL